MPFKSSQLCPPACRSTTDWLESAGRLPELLGGSCVPSSERAAVACWACGGVSGSPGRKRATRPAMTMATAAAAASATLRKGPLAVGSDETPGPRGGLGGAPRPVPTLRSDSRLVDDSRELHAVHARVVFLQRSLRVSSDRRWVSWGFRRWPSDAGAMHGGAFGSRQWRSHRCRRPAIAGWE